MARGFGVCRPDVLVDKAIQVDALRRRCWETAKGVV